MSTLNERMSQAKSIPMKQAIIDEAKFITHQYAMQYPTKIQVTSLTKAERAFKDKEANGAADSEQLYSRYVEILLDFADFIIVLEAQKR